MEEITKALPGIIDSVVEIPEVPEMPKATGPAIPFQLTAGALPGIIIQ